MEALIETFLTSCGKVFLSPQYNIPFVKSSGAGGSNPDFIALDFSRRTREVVVVEITTSSNITALEAKIRERQSRWFQPLMTSLKEDAIIDDTWSIRFLGFVRETNIKSARSHFLTEQDVWFYPIERAIISYEYWDTRMKTGLPRPSSREQV